MTGTSPRRPYRTVRESLRNESFNCGGANVFGRIKGMGACRFSGLGVKAYEAILPPSALFLFPKIDADALGLALLAVGGGYCSVLTLEYRSSSSLRSLLSLSTP